MQSPGVCELTSEPDALSFSLGAISKQRSKHFAKVKELLDGDSVTVIKDLKVKGSSMVIKRGPKVKSIRLTENPEEVDCKIDGSSIVLKTCFLKK